MFIVGAAILAIIFGAMALLSWEQGANGWWVWALVSCVFAYPYLTAVVL